MVKSETTKITIEELANFCKREGFVFRSSEIYGGFAGFLDFGPLGVELMNNIKKNWWNYFVHQKDNMVGVEASIISHPKTWIASGHVANFNDVAAGDKRVRGFPRTEPMSTQKVEQTRGQVKTLIMEPIRRTVGRHKQRIRVHESARAHKTA